VLTAAALAEFAAREVEVAVVEAGLGGRHDATNVLAAPVVVLTNVALDHTDVLGETREQIAAEKLAVASPDAMLIAGEPEWGGGYAEDVGRAAAEAFLGRRLEGDVEISLPGRFDVVGDDVFAGAHNPAGVEWLLERLPRNDYVVVASILADKDAEAMLRLLARAGRNLVATSSRSARALPAEELAKAAAPFFDSVEVEPDPERAFNRADGPVLVTGSLYLITDLSVRLQRIP
jgi:dihydrofolate synthase/folylpolyglutamate synthase